ncbi:MAG: Phosphomannomutase/phosphoglucomutase [Holosporales bacterium]
MHQLPCFKAYDIRGKIPTELNTDLVYKIAKAYVAVFSPRKIIIGRDGRLESPSIAEAFCNGVLDSGVDVIDIGLCGTEEVYFHTFNQESCGVDGGVMVTASHNPKGYNGLKMVQKGALPVSKHHGLDAIHDLVVRDIFSPPSKRGTYQQQPDKSAYIDHLLSYVVNAPLKKIKIVANPGNGTAGLVLKQIEKHLPFDFFYIHDTVDGNFPNGVPNPLLPENRMVTSQAVREHKADLGIAFDGDFDRCFFFDETGAFIDSYYIVGLLARVFLEQDGPNKIIHDPRLIWNTTETVHRFGGEAIQCQTGHTFIKEKMRNVDAIYGGEMSAHHYFKSFSYCDSGMIPWLLMTKLLVQAPLSEHVRLCMQAYPISGEINYTVSSSKNILDQLYSAYAQTAKRIDQNDGLSFEFDDWRFNVRASNTEPLLRLNIETKAKPQLVIEKKEEIESVIKPFLTV